MMRAAEMSMEWKSSLIPRKRHRHCPPNLFRFNHFVNTAGRGFFYRKLSDYTADVRRANSSGFMGFGLQMNRRAQARCINENTDAIRFIIYGICFIRQSGNDYGAMVSYWPAWSGLLKTLY